MSYGHQSVRTTTSTQNDTFILHLLLIDFGWMISIDAGVLDFFTKEIENLIEQLSILSHLNVKKASTD